MDLRRRFLPWLFAALLAAACHSTRRMPGPVDNWGPAAGFTVVEGTIYSASDQRPVVGAEVMLSRCTDPIGGYLGGDTTDASGRYRIAGFLPPVGLLPLESVDTLRVRCYAFVNRRPAPLDSLDLRFSAKREETPRTTLDLRVP